MTFGQNKLKQVSLSYCFKSACCRHSHSLLKTLLCGFKMLPSLYYLCQTHLITWNLGFVPDVIIKSSKGFTSRQASVSCTQTLHPFTASISAPQDKTPLAVSPFQTVRSPRGLRIVFVLLWKQQHGYETSLRPGVKSWAHSSDSRWQGQQGSQTLPQHLEALTATPHRAHALWPPLRKREPYKQPS